MPIACFYTGDRQRNIVNLANEEKMFWAAYGYYDHLNGFIGLMKKGASVYLPLFCAKYLAL